MDLQELNGGQGKKKYECEHEKCGYQTNKLFNFQRHRKIHEKKRPLPMDSPQDSSGSPSAKIQRLDIECAQQDCSYTGDQLEDYVEHVHSCHNNDLKFVDKRFDDRDSLEAYLHKLQEHSSCSMILSRTLDGEPNESFELCCSASGRYRRRRRSDGAGGAFLESSGEFRSGIYCTFYLAINVYDNAIYVKGCESHFGHPVEIPAARANPMAAAAAFLAAKLEVGPPVLPALTTAAAGGLPISMDDLLMLQKPISSARASEENACTEEEDDENALVIVEDQIIDVEDPKPTDYQSELRRIALDIQTETELFLETPEAALNEAEFQELEKTTTKILQLLRSCRLRPPLSTLRTTNVNTPQPNLSASTAMNAAATLLTPPTSSTAPSTVGSSGRGAEVSPVGAAACLPPTPTSVLGPAGQTPSNGPLGMHLERLQQIIQHQQQQFALQRLSAGLHGVHPAAAQLQGLSTGAPNGSAAAAMVNQQLNALNAARFAAASPFMQPQGAQPASANLLAALAAMSAKNAGLPTTSAAAGLSQPTNNNFLNNLHQLRQLSGEQSAAAQSPLQGHEEFMRKTLHDFQTTRTAGGC
ncbi:hypothetical protein M3Y99_00952900 [Aphelenchoides fujianensis]|nr:hypothetical protein M3Y99_01129100 [Aphelenchoides fujianensis]KAI6233104.1 hypothetical protein M3Y99_00952900 [Aphelenchoides fujianensis]